MGDLETCLSHITGNCPNPTTKKGPTCITNEHKKNCPHYNPTKLRTFEVIDPNDNTQLYNDNL